VNYYNEWDKTAGAWLRELIKDQQIPEGFVDDRSITDVRPEDLIHYTQCHFFAGIGGWSYALRLAGWHPDRPVWTGSCPCQSFSVAGKGKGKDDARHLWPAFFNLIRECRPPTVFGEQVSAAIRYGWIDDLQRDMEGAGYACGYAVLGAHSVGAPHIRQRLYWLADAEHAIGRQIVRPVKDGRDGQDGGRAETHGELGTCGEVRGLADCEQSGCEGRLRGGQDQGREDLDGHAGRGSATHWDASRPHLCRDGKYRIVPLEPALFPLANGLPGRVGLLRGAGNAIVPETAAAFIQACSV
jgi:DNA (cytosine-5)-methyltransferase 1